MRESSRLSEARPDADERLFRLIDCYRRVEQILANVERGTVAAPGDSAANRRVELASRLQADFALAVMTTPAATLAGALGKLQIAASWFRPDTLEPAPAPLLHHADDVLVAIADEIAALGQGAAAAGPCGLADDAELLALARQFGSGAALRAELTRQLDEAVAQDLPLPTFERLEREREPVIDARDALYGRIGRVPARTVAGVLAKLIVAAEELSAAPDRMIFFTADQSGSYVLASAVCDALALSGWPEASGPLATIRAALGLEER